MHLRTRSRIARSSRLCMCMYRRRVRMSWVRYPSANGATMTCQCGHSPADHVLNASTGERHCTVWDGSMCPCQSPSDLVRMVRLEAEVGKLRETIFALLGVMLEAGDSRSPLRSQTPEDQLLIIEETARMAAKVMGITVPDECDRVTLRRAIAIGYARGT